MTTITANSTNGVYLTAPSDTNPVVVDAGVTITGNIGGIGYGIYARSGAWTITNAGNVEGVGTSGDGIYLGSGGAVSNQTGGVIGSSGDPSAIYITGGIGAVVNAATINAGVWLQAGGSVTNQTGGRIVSNSTTGGYGVGFHAGGTLTNAGLIGGPLIGVDGSHDGAAVTNQSGGTIVGQYAGVLMAVVDQPTAGIRAVINQADGTITGDSGFLAGGSSATVANGGIITGTFAGTIAHNGVTLVVGAGVSFSDGGTVTNQLGGIITGVSYGVQISNATGTVVNYGSIAGTGTVGLGVALVDGGLISNAATGSIIGAGANGVLISGAAGTLLNAGMIVAAGGTHSAVALLQGGFVDNAGTGTISGALSGGVYVTGGAAAVVNAGHILSGGTHSAVVLEEGGSVTNQVGGTITGTTLHTAIYVTGAAGTVSNYSLVTDGVDLNHGGAVTNQSGGVIVNPGGNGVQFTTGGRLVNAAGGTIASQGTSASAVFFNSAAGTVITGGLITATGNAGVRFAAAGYVHNLPGGTIVSALQDGIVFRGGTGTLLNDGTIAGHGSVYDGVIFHQVGGTVTNTQSGAITGTAIGIFFYQSGGTVTNAGSIGGGTQGVVLEAGGAVTNAASGTISGASAIGIYVDAGTVVNDGLITGGAKGVALFAGGTLTDAGTINASGTAVAFYGTGINRLVLDPGFGITGFVEGSVTGSNTMELASGAASGAVAGLGSQFMNFGSIDFDSGADWVVAGNASGLAGTISGFAQGDTIAITGITVTGSSYAGGVLTLIETSGSATLNLPGTFSTESFVVTNVAGAADVSLACFRGGTRIRTVRGDVPVEQLRVGEQAWSLLGRAFAPIKWIGHRTVDCRRHPRPWQVWPVRVSAGAFGPGLPLRDLYLSPDHAVYVDGTLVPIRYLINGGSIAQEPTDALIYYHVELPRHGVLLAEGLAAESYLDTGNRCDFANSDGVMRLFPDFSSDAWRLAEAWEANGCAPLIVTGPRLEAMRVRLSAPPTTAIPPVVHRARQRTRPRRASPAA